jgi:hypothetical protein
MFTTGSATEGTLPTEERPEVTEKISIAKLLFGFTGLYERWRNEYEARRYQDPRDRDPDYARKLRELEGQIADIDREQQGFRGNINHTEGGGKESSWKDWVLGLVGLAIVAWLGRLSMQMDDLLSMRGEQKMMEKHLESTDNHVERLENHVFRGSP